MQFTIRGILPDLHMPRVMLDQAITDADRAELPVRVPALLAIARVLTAFDDQEALLVLERALALMEGLSDEVRDALGPEALCAAGTVSPEHAWRMLDNVVARSGEDHLWRLLMDMLHYKRADEAVAFLADFNRAGRFPVTALGDALRHAKDMETKRKLLRRAAEYWRRGSTPSMGNRFEETFQHVWKILPAEESLAIVREIASRIESEPDRHISGHIGGDPPVRFTSARAHSLFGLLAPLRYLAPEIADDALRVHPELALAAAQFPLGYESIHSAIPARPPMSTAERTEWFRAHDLVACGDEWVPLPEAMSTEFARPFAIAARTFANDTASRNPNGAPKSLWPSTADYRNILRKAGAYEGHGATRYLDRIPDPDLRLFAQIELAAALAGVPQFSYSTQFRPPQP